MTTLLHELVHLWLGLTGISAGYPDIKIEKYCNDIASHILLSNEDIAGHKFDTENEIIPYINDLSSKANVSRSLILYRLFIQNSISEEFWQETSSQFRDEWIRRKEEEKLDRKKKRGDAGGGPNYYVVKRHKLGDALTSFVRRSVQDGALTPTKAGMVLGVRPIKVFTLLRNGAV